jgi:hypothetical protein
VGVESESGGPSPELGLEQFDFASSGTLMSAFGAGWQEPEANPSTGLFWRWSSDRNAMLVFAGERDVRVQVAGESPLRYFDEAPTVRVMADGREFGRFTPPRFRRIDQIRARHRCRPTEATIETDQCSAGRISGSPDRRRLGLRVYRVEVSEIR